MEQLGERTSEHFKKTIKFVIDTIAFYQLLRLRIIETDFDNEIKLSHQIAKLLICTIIWNICIDFIAYQIVIIKNIYCEKSLKEEMNL